jgi:hypothetical protein
MARILCCPRRNLTKLAVISLKWPYFSWWTRFVEDILDWNFAGHFDGGGSVVFVSGR